VGRIHWRRWASSGSYRLLESLRDLIYKQSSLQTTTIEGNGSDSRGLGAVPLNFQPGKGRIQVPVTLKEQRIEVRRHRPFFGSCHDGGTCHIATPQLK
jgi:hypothetical protein